MNGGIDAVVLVGLFSLGCVAIHGLRRHAKRMTPVLTLVLLCLGPFTGLVALALRPMALQNGSGMAASPPKRPAGQDARSEPSATNGIRLAQAEKAERHDRPRPSTDADALAGRPSDGPKRTALPEQDASPDGIGETPRSPASRNAERIK